MYRTNDSLLRCLQITRWRGQDHSDEINVTCSCLFVLYAEFLPHPPRVSTTPGHRRIEIPDGVDRREQGAHVLRDIKRVPPVAGLHRPSSFFALRIFGPHNLCLYDRFPSAVILESAHFGEQMSIGYILNTSHRL